MTIQEILEQLKTIKANYVNGNITGDDTIELIEDIIHDVEGNDGMSWSDDDMWEGSFEQPDFTQLEI